MTVSASGYWTLVEAFLAGRTSPNTRAAYRRDLIVLAEALGVAQPDQPPRAVFGVEDDASAHQAARDLAAIAPQWWQSWRDELPGTAASRRRRVAGVRAFCRWWSTMFALHNPVQDLSPPGGVADAKRQLGREVVALDQAQIRAMCEAWLRAPAVRRAPADTHSSRRSTAWGCARARRHH